MTISQKTVWLSVPTSTAMNTMMAMPMPALMTWRPGNRIGLPDMRPSSFRNAMIEPVKVTAPMATPIDISTSATGLIEPTSPMPNEAGE